MTLGAVKQGIDVLVGIDNDQKYIQTYAHNFGENRTLPADLTTHKPKAVLNKLKLKKGELDYIFGGSPCQGFSKNVPKKNRTIDSEDNVLVYTFLDYCKELFPKNIIMENVAEMKNGFESVYTEYVVQNLINMGYKVAFGVLNACNYGVPQRRKRTFFLASRIKSNIFMPPPTHSIKNENDLFSLNPSVNVWDAISDLPSLKHAEGDVETEYRTEASSTYQKLMRNCSQTVTNHVARKLAPRQYERLASLKAGEGFKDLPEHLKTKGKRNSRKNQGDD